MRQLSVVTLNTWKCDGDFPRRLHLMGAQLRELSPDLLLLQEAFRSADSAFDTAAYLAGQLGLHCRFHPARYKVRRVVDQEVLSWSGLAILSRYKPSESGALQLPTDPRDGDRWAQWLDVEVDGVALRLINTHLCHLVDREDLREHALKQVIKVLARHCARRLVLLGGDLNTEPQAPALRWLAQQRVCAAHSAWLEIAGGLPPATYPMGNPAACLDHLYLFESAFVEARWGEVRRALDLPDRQGCYPSDHAALHAVLVVFDTGGGHRK